MDFIVERIHKIQRPIKYETTTLCIGRANVLIVKFYVPKCIWQIQENWPQILIKLQYTCNWLNNTCSIKCEILSKSFLYQIFFCSVQWHKLFILALQLLGRPKVCQFVHRPRNNTQPWLMATKYIVKVCQFVHGPTKI